MRAQIKALASKLGLLKNKAQTRECQDSGSFSSRLKQDLKTVFLARKPKMGQLFLNLRLKEGMVVKFERLKLSLGLALKAWAQNVWAHSSNKNLREV